MLLNLATSIDSLTLMSWAQAQGAWYLDTCIDPWAYRDGELASGDNTNYRMRQAVIERQTAQRRSGVPLPTAVVAHGANPGMVSIFAKEALLRMARRWRPQPVAPVGRIEWAQLAQALGVRVIQVSERDTQSGAMPRAPGEFVNTWSVDGFIAEALQRFGHIDGLVNNAGIAGPHGTRLQDMDWHEWQRRLSSLHGAFLCSKHALPALTDSAAGAIINIASTRAWQSEAHSEAYAAAKGGLVAFTHALAISAGPAVRVNSISPGWVGTTAWQAPSRRHEPEYSAIDHAQHPVGRVGRPEDIGALAVYLLSSLSGFSTGQDFIVDGGMTRKMIYAE